MRKQNVTVTELHKMDFSDRFACMKTICKSIGYMFVTMLFCVVVFASSVFISHAAFAGEVYTNPDTGYQVVIEDDAELLMDYEREELAEVMKEITVWGNVVFKTIDDNPTSTGLFAERYYHELFDKNSGTLFLIDMDNRNIWIFSDGAVYRTVTQSYADTVTDNVYRYASREEYYECAAKVFEQITSLLKGQRIAQPMKYISNFLLAATLALLFNFVFVLSVTKIRRPRQDELLRTVQKRFTSTKVNATFTHKSKTYSPQSSGSSGGGGGGHSGGGGGGHSGGGGGHSF